jgi:hypothetical protein
MKKIILFLFLIAGVTFKSFFVFLTPYGNYGEKVKTQLPFAATTPTIAVMLGKQIDLNNFSNGCIPPLEKFAYSVNKDNKKPIPGNTLNILPSPDWKFVNKIPSVKNTTKYKLISQSIAKVLDDTKNQEIWILNAYFQTVSGETFFDYSVYGNEKKWVTISAEVAGNEKVFTKGLYYINGNLFGVNDQSFGDDYALFSKFNKLTQKFEPVQTSITIPVGSYDKGGLFHKSIVRLDSNRVFWIIVPEGSIYKYNPISGQINKEADIPSSHIISDFRFAADKSIYYYAFDEAGKGTNYLPPMVLYHYIPEKKQFTQIYIPLEPSGFPNILIDRQDRLWLGGSGWKESDNTWYQILRSSVFITNSQEGGSEPRWKSPYVLIESSDGRLWFQSDNGMTWLNPQKGEWCWFTTYQSNLVEDSDHNLWMIADGKLYKNALGK